MPVFARINFMPRSYITLTLIAAASVIGALFSPVFIERKTMSAEASMPRQCVAKGEIYFPEKVILPTGAKATISVVESGIADIAAPVLGKMTIIVGKPRQLPFKFAILLNCAKLKKTHLPAITGKIVDKDGKLLFRNMTTHDYDRTGRFHRIRLDRIK